MYYAIRLCRLINAVVSYAHKPVKSSEYSVSNYPVMSCCVLLFPVLYFFCLFYRHINVVISPLLHSCPYKNKVFCFAL
nr:MAG TPA: hypothetical protein [Caudoviricetes sp.]DAI83238.1 MAG TPA: hypothetical protein [Caudoviricetes sp.]DAI92308.1 MAG TPA: hypothetical protein [Bacteriophage sp.]